jgi:predicted transcriptional regulator
MLHGDQFRWYGTLTKRLLKRSNPRRPRLSSEISETHAVIVLLWGPPDDIYHQSSGRPVMSDESSTPNFVELAADIVAAYVSKNAIATTDLPILIGTIHSALASAATAASQPQEAEKLVPAVPIKKSITPDAIICLEDGKAFKSLKRHLNTKYGLTPEEYRAKWGLPHDYPMVAPNYATARSNLAKQMGLGQQRRKTAAKAATTAKAKRAKAA